MYNFWFTWNDKNRWQQVQLIFLLFVLSYFTFNCHKDTHYKYFFIFYFFHDFFFPLTLFFINSLCERKWIGKLYFCETLWLKMRKLKEINEPYLITSFPAAHSVWQFFHLLPFIWTRRKKLEREANVYYGTICAH